MSLTEIDTTNEFFAALTVDGRAEIHQDPVDAKLKRGLPIRNLGELTMNLIDDRMVRVLIDLSQDETREASECVAYGFLNEAEEAEMDRMLVEKAQVLLEGEPTETALWEGGDDRHTYQLRKTASFIILEDGAMPSGVVYSLHGSLRDHLG